MADFKLTRQCATCGSKCELKDGVFICPSCGNVYVKDNQSDKLFFDLSFAQSCRQNAEFSKAKKIYNDIIANNKTADVSEAYWGLFLCENNVVFEYDSKGEAFPSFYSVTETPATNLKSYSDAIYYAGKNAPAKVVAYKMTAAQIEQARKNYFEISSNNEPYDIFICFRDLVPDNMTARDLYNHLSDKYRVFFSTVSLNNVKGNYREYEPNIFYALYSAKVMLLICTSNNNIESQWVKNEWSRFSEINANCQKPIIPIFSGGYQPSLLPKELAKAQGLFDGRSLVADLTSNLNGIFNKKETTTNNAVNVKNIERRADIELQSGNFDKAKSLYDDILNQEPENGNAWWGLFLSEQKINNVNTIIDIKNTTVYKVHDNSNYLNALKFADDDLKQKIILLNQNANELLPLVNEYLVNGRITGAKRAYQKILSVSPACAEAWWGLMCLNFNWNGKDIDRAVSISSQVLENSMEYQNAIKYATGNERMKYFQILSEIKKHEYVAAEAEKLEIEKKKEEERIRLKQIEEQKRKEEEEKLKLLEEQKRREEALHNINIARQEQVKNGNDTIPDEKVEIDGFKRPTQETRRQQMLNTYSNVVKDKKFKHFCIKFSIVVAVLLVAVLIIWNVFATLSNGILSYNLNDDGQTYKVTGYLSLDKASTVTIPEEYNGKKVTTIADNLFKNKTKLLKVELPNTITSIGKDAFKGTGFYNDATNWTGDLLYIGSCLIEARSTTLNSFEFNANTSLIGDYAFANCTNLANVTLLDTIKYVGNFAFMGCTSLTDFTFTKNTLSIGNGIFSGNEELVNINMPTENKNYVVDGGVLYSKDKSMLISYPVGNSNISFTIPSSVVTICDNAFYHTKLLKNIKFEDDSKLETIGENAFNNCLVLKELNCPSKLKTIGKYAFANCVSLNTITISSSVESIGTSAFASCGSLDEVFINSYTIASNISTSSSEGGLCADEDSYIYINTKIGANNVGNFISKKYEMGTKIISIEGETYYRYIRK